MLSVITISVCRDSILISHWIIKCHRILYNYFSIPPSGSCSYHSYRMNMPEYFLYTLWSKILHSITIGDIVSLSSLHLLRRGDCKQSHWYEISNFSFSELVLDHCNLKPQCILLGYFSSATSIYWSCLYLLLVWDIAHVLFSLSYWLCWFFTRYYVVLSTMSYLTWYPWLFSSALLLSFLSIKAYHTSLSQIPFQ